MIIVHTKFSSLHRRSAYEGGTATGGHRGTGLHDDYTDNVIIVTETKCISRWYSERRPSVVLVSVIVIRTMFSYQSVVIVQS